PEWSPQGKALPRTWRELEWERGVGAHWIELAALALDLPLPSRVRVLQDSPVLRLGLQLFTSDPKKDWDLQNWWSLAERLREIFPEIEVSFLVAPFEVDRLTETQNRDPRLRILRWPQLENYLSDLDLLVSGDTSVLHLAVEKGVRCLGLYMGSAQALSSGPYQLNPWVLQASSRCFPCGPSSVCEQTRHWCGDSIKVESVFDELFKYIEGRKNAKLSVQSGDSVPFVKSSANHLAL
ncbi:MAG: glycosyltransferase family 9 protein, partial [Bdellovibrio sp.]